MFQKNMFVTTQKQNYLEKKKRIGNWTPEKKGGREKIFSLQKHITKFKKLQKRPLFQI